MGRSSRSTAPTIYQDSRNCYIIGHTQSMTGTLVELITRTLPFKSRSKSEFSFEQVDVGSFTIFDMPGCSYGDTVVPEFTGNYLKMMAGRKTMQCLVVVANVGDDKLPKNILNLFKILKEIIAPSFKKHVCLVLTTLGDECNVSSTSNCLVSMMKSTLDMEHLDVFTVNVKSGSADMLLEWMNSTPSIPIDCSALATVDPQWKSIQVTKEKTEVNHEEIALEVSEIVRVNEKSLEAVFGAEFKAIVGNKRKVEDDGMVVMQKKKVVGYTIRKEYHLQLTRYCTPWISNETQHVERETVGQYFVEEFVPGAPTSSNTVTSIKCETK